MEVRAGGRSLGGSVNPRALPRQLRIVAARSLHVPAA